MKRTIVSHDTNTGIAIIKFEHNDVTFEDSFDLKKVIPGSEHILNEMGIEFTKKHQQTVIDKLTTTVQSHIEAGVIKNSPVPEVTEYTPPPVVEEPTEKKH
jgi:hypothetical protein